MKNVIRILFISIVITFTGLYFFLRANAAVLLIVPVLPTGKCADVGNIAGMVKEVGPAGTTYFSNKEGATITATLTIASPFAVAMYDADGQPSTDLALLNHGAQVWQHSFSTVNNEWSKIYTVTITVDALALTLPADHASTHLCLIVASPEPTETPTDVSTPIIVESSTPTPQTPVETTTAASTSSATATVGEPVEPTSTPVLLVADLRIEAEVAGYMSPTGLTPAPEPIHTSAVNDNVPVVPIGSTVIVTISITNRGNTPAENVALDIASNGITETVAVGRVASGVRVVAQYLAVVTEGLTIATITARSSTHDTDPSNNTQSVLWMAGDDGDGEVCGQSCDNVKVFLPVIQR